MLTTRRILMNNLIEYVFYAAQQLVQYFPAT
uniref:Uncharacterized protein n=1 Tax=Moniliophthora roreri TaxID=221103 RepID=A0A0W0GBZ3_MONRR